MGTISLSDTEREAIASIDEVQLDRLIDQAIWSEQLGDLHTLRLSSCGTYVGQKLSYFRQALSSYSQAKAAKKRAETKYYVEKAGSDLKFAVAQMKGRLRQEEKDRESFKISDHVSWPARITPNFSATVGFSWRQHDTGEWHYGHITFTHKVVLRRDYFKPLPRRKPSTSKQRQDLEDELSRRWEHFSQDALLTVQEYFRQGGDGSLIPETFAALPGPSGELNNFSLRFWKSAR